MITAMSLNWVLFFVIAGLSALAANLSFFYMEYQLQRQQEGYRLKLLKYPWDLRRVYAQYLVLAKQGLAPW
jgi:hypothetical protein